MTTPLPRDLQAAILQRLRFERDLGVESVRVVPIQRALLSPSSAPPAHSTSASKTSTSTPPAQSTSAPASARPANLASPVPEGLTPQEREARWKSLEARALACTACALHQGRTKVVFGEGNREARLVFVGEGPGEDEDRTGRPFVGKAGQLLNKIIGAMGLTREQVYICNVVKCRPPDNRTPLPDETAQCWPFLEEQLALIAPRAIVALGSPAAKTLLKTGEGITRLRGRWQLYRGIRVMPTFHPAYVLRTYTEATRRAVWEDMQQVMAYLNAEESQTL